MSRVKINGQFHLSIEEEFLNPSLSDSQQPQLFLYSMSSLDPGKVPLNIPDLIRLALTDTKRSLQDYHQKKMFIQGELCRLRTCILF